jgi:hypothetical protein
MATFGNSTTNTGAGMFGTGTFGTTTAKPTFGQTTTNTGTGTFGTGTFGTTTAKPTFGQTTTNTGTGMFGLPTTTANPTGTFVFTQQQPQQAGTTANAAGTTGATFGFPQAQQQQQAGTTTNAAGTTGATFGFPQAQQQAPANTDKNHLGKTLLDYIVVMKSQLDKLVPPSEPIVHTGVMCKGCGKTHIVGVRYKCVVCTDYDLCEQCEAHGIHHEHVFVKIKDTRKFNALFPAFQK